MIPKIIHQIWFGDQSLRPLEAMRTWPAKHPGWEYRLWTEKDLFPLENQRLFDQMHGYKMFAGCSDVARYEILHRHGGIFCDADTECLRSLDDLLQYDCFAVYENEEAKKGLLANGFIGCGPGNALMKSLVSALSGASISPEEPAWVVSGPVLLTRIAEEQDHLIVKLPSWTTYPEHQSGKKSAGRSYARHFWGATLAKYGHIRFVRENLSADEARGKSVLESGEPAGKSPLHLIVEGLGPGRYDVSPPEALLERFGPESFDAVICAEAIDRIRDWRSTVSGLKKVLKPGGVLILSARSPGFPHHYRNRPLDYWRFEPEDMRAVFADFEIAAIESDPLEPGVFLKARKPAAFKERDLADIRLYSIVTGRRCLEVSDAELRLFRLRAKAREVMSRITPRPIKTALKKILR